MWMQIMAAAGCTVVGEAFPMDWEERIKATNPRGFFETTLRLGINFTTNPDPHTGACIRPESSGDWVTKVMTVGVRRTERVYLDRVLVSVRRWSDYVASIQRMFVMDKGPEADTPMPSAERHALWWFLEHQATIMDAEQRGYPLRLVSYEQTLAQPAQIVPEVLDWLGAGGDPQSAVAAVDPGLRTQHASAKLALDLPARWTDAFDELGARVQTREVMVQGWLEHMSEIRDEIEQSGWSGEVVEAPVWSATKL
jgi:hypothetical protein